MLTLMLLYRLMSLLGYPMVTCSLSECNDGTSQRDLLTAKAVMVSLVLGSYDIHSMII